jgi:ABC-type cobalt transport system substrate-binding protein
VPLTPRSISNFKKKEKKTLHLNFETATGRKLCTDGGIAAAISSRMFAQDPDYVFGEEDDERAADSDDETGTESAETTEPFDPEVQQAYEKRKGDLESLLDTLSLKGAGTSQENWGQADAAESAGPQGDSATLPESKEGPQEGSQEGNQAEASEGEKEAAPTGNPEGEERAIFHLRQWLAVA